MLLLVGLGNPGAEHTNNRHNIGFMAVDEIIRRHSFGPRRERFNGRAAEGRIGNTKILALKPATYMNESGLAVGNAARFYKLEPDDIIVLHDDIDLVPGKVRVKRGGGAAGHNGLRSIDSHIGKDYLRVRIGVGHPGDKDEVERYVLRNFPREDMRWVEALTGAIAECLPLLLGDDGAGFMSKVALLTAPPKPPKPKGPPKESTEEATEPCGPAEKP
ncbi:MAG: aminoacyl-tRNA hydrolase [Proteobacteria bacterium]|nr:aminoacyl-tRNA hydrolase [Pseudomonadota bacterium]